MESVHSISETVKSYQVDFNKKLKLSSLFEMFQEAAYQHAEILGVGLAELNKIKQLWVLSRLIIEIHELPEWGENIILNTWPKGIKGPFALRDFQITNSQGNIFINATSAWLILNQETRKPVRPSEALQFIKCCEVSAINEFPEKLPDGLFNNTRFFSADYNSIDVNNHVNNARYIEWITDCMNINFFKHNHIKKLQINFNSETVWNDNISIDYGLYTDNEYLFTINNNNTTQTACQVKIQFIQE